MDDLLNIIFEVCCYEWQQDTKINFCKRNKNDKQQLNIFL